MDRELEKKIIDLIYMCNELEAYLHWKLRIKDCKSIEFFRILNYDNLKLDFIDNEGIRNIYEINSSKIKKHFERRVKYLLKKKENPRIEKTEKALSKMLDSFSA